MSSARGVDRRILRAFYTQYVSVLLILLVFSVGAAQRSSHPKDHIHNPAAIELPSDAQTKAPIGSLKLVGVFATESSSELRAGDVVEPVFETLRNHDLRAIFTVYLGLDGDRQHSVDLARARAEVLRELFAKSKVPNEAVLIVFVPSMHASPDITVAFESLEV